ncbi:MAG: chromosome segregation protein SMC, partial [Bdellovibrionia bacterium]
EAAGIAKYKARKKESLKKMEATQANLARLTDIIQEIEKSLASLERQAQKARQYKKYKDELFSVEISWGKRKYALSQRRLDSLKQRKETLEQDLVGLKAELQSAENSIEVDRVALLTETKTAELYQAKIQDLADELSHERSALELSRQRKGDLALQLEALGQEKSELEITLQSDQAREVEIEQEVLQVEERFAQLSSELQEMNETLFQLRRETETVRSQMHSTQHELRSQVSEISELTSQASGLASKAESAQAQMERLAQQLEIQKERLAEIHEEKERLSCSSSELQAQKETLLAEKKSHAETLQNDELELREQEKQKDQSLRALTQLKSKLQSLEELDAAHEGLSDGPKAALDWAKAHGKTHQIQPLTDALQVKSGYELVLQSWLESRIDTLVSLSDETGESSEFLLELLEEVKTQKQGRVSIQRQVLSTHRPSQAHGSFADVSENLTQAGISVLGELSQFVSPKTQFSQLSALQDLFAQVCVVESSHSLKPLFQSKAAPALLGWAVVSLDGVVVEPEGAIRGGSLEASGAIGILKRKHAIEELKGQAAQADEAHAELEHQVQQSQEKVELLRARKAALQDEFQQVEIQSAALQRDLHQTERALAEATRHFSSLEQDHQEAMNEQAHATEAQEEIRLQIQDLVTQKMQLEETLLAAETNLSTQDSELREKETQLQSVRIQEVSLKERLSSLRRELQSLQSLISDRKRRSVEITRTLERASQEQAQHQGGESELTQKIEELTYSLTTSKDELSTVKDRMEQLNSRVQGGMERIKALHKGSETQTSEATQIAVELEKISAELSHLVLNLEEKYGPGCLQAQPVVINESSESETDTEQGEQESLTQPASEQSRELQEIQELSAEEEIALGEQVERLRERIRRLGEVNVMAIEEHDQLKKRYDHLLNEKADLDRSLTNLQEAIDHINKTSEERYRKAFEAIAERFEKLFPVIFGGGSAKLSLIYPENSQDILEAGVDILAQPPGKKVSNITLLSGGEKALTAVSLIFAIFMVKPSPFCVLDEVDAPLDDANIGKFNALLKEMSAKSQFILITHNKKTMELNDTLYGVTMEEPGVSKMVSIEMHA